MDLDTVRLKTASQLDDAEKAFIKDNVDKLTDEDKDAYADFLNPESNEGESEDDSSNQGFGDGSMGDNGEGGASDQSATDQGSENDNSSSNSTYAFKSKEEAAAFVKEQLEANEKEKQAAIDAARTPEEKKWVEDNWKPKNWNEGIKTAAEAAADLIEERQAAKEAKRQENAKRAEADWQTLRKEHSLPDVDTDEGAKIHNQIIDIGIKHGKQNFQQAYELWAMIPVEKGGGYTIDPSQAGKTLAEQKAKQLSDQKKVAAKMSGQSQGTGKAGNQTPVEAPEYKDLKKAKSARDLYKHLL